MCSFFLRSLTLTLSLAVVSAKPSAQLSETEFTNLQFTVQKLDAILKAYAPYKEYVPDYVWSAIDGLTDEQKTQVVQMVNDYHDGKFEPKNYEDYLAIMKKSYPAIAGTYETMHTKYQAQVDTLGPKGQEFAKQTEAQVFADASPDRIVWACHIFNGAKSLISNAKALLLDADEADKIDAAFPEVVTFMNSKEFEAYSIVVSNLNSLDCEKDRKQIFDTIKLMDKQNVFTSN
uniref:Uncharacterized protein n=1 Tax=Caenorhabditis japonica TaxID=281687 RepID=A0A8R1DSP3_CAEJA